MGPNRINPLLFLSLCFSALVAGLHIAAGIFFLYYSIWWIDKPIHFIGGLAVGTSVIYLFGLKDLNGQYLTDRRIFFIAVGVACLFGFAWEIFEFVFHLIYVANYFLDTATDLFFDLLGGVAAFSVAAYSLSSKRLKANQNHL